MANKVLAQSYVAPMVEVEGTGKGALALGKKAKVHKDLAERLVKKGTAKYPTK